MLRLFDVMGKAEFQLAYDGPSLRYGTMDVNELASSLLAVGDAVRASNAQLNGERAEISVRVRSDFKKGSFEISLVLDQSLLEQAKNLLFPGAATIGAGTIIGLLFGTESGKKGVTGAIDSVLDLWKKLKGEKPQAVVQDAERGITIYQIGDNNQVNVNPATAALYAKDSIRGAIAGVVKPVSKRGIKSLEIRQGKKTINVVEKQDLPSSLEDIGARSDSKASGKILRDTREAVVRVSRANFEKGKWGFSDGTAKFSAEITDQAYKKKMDDHEVGFFKGDTLRVVLTTTQVISEDGQTFHTRYEIEKVIEHVHAPRQQDLLIPPSD